MYIWNALDSFITLIGEDVARDSIEVACEFIWKSRELFQNLFYDSFIKIINNNACCYDETLKDSMLYIKKKIKGNKKKFIDWINSIVYDDLVKYIQDLKSRGFQKQLSAKLFEIYNIEYSENFFNILFDIVDDTFSFYGISIISCVSKSNKADDLILFQILKTDDVLKSIDILCSHNNLLPDVKIELDKIKSTILIKNNTTDNLITEKKIFECENISLVNQVRDLLVSRRFICTEINNDSFYAKSRVYFNLNISVKCPNDSNIITLITKVKDFIISSIGSIGLIVVDKNQYSTLLRHGINEQSLLKIVTFDELVENHTSLTHYSALLPETLKMPSFFIDEFYGISNDNIFDLVEHIDSLVCNVNIHKIAVLGDYGVGKTVFCHYYIRHCMENYNQNDSLRLPVYLDLKKFSNQRNLFELMMEEINKQSFVVSEYELKELMRIGKLLIIIDGLESIKPDIPFEIIVRLIDALGDYPLSKILLTARTHFFRNNMQLQRIREYSSVYLKNWSLSDCKRYLMKRYGIQWNDIASKIFTSFHLFEIFQTPLFATELCNVIDNGITKHADIFNALINSWIEKNYYFLYLNTTIKLSIIEKIACTLYYKNSLTFSENELNEIIDSCSVRAENIDKYKTDILTSSFIVRDKDDNYRFSHYSIMEYFIARVLEREVIDINQNKIQPSKKFYFSRRKLTSGIYQFLSDLIENEEVLLKIVKMTKNKSFSDTGYIGSNCISILRCKGTNLSNNDFSHCVLVDSDFRSIDLSGSSFEAANLYTTNFDNCILDNTNFVDAELSYSSIKCFSGIFDFVIIDQSKLLLATMQNMIFLFDIKEKYAKIVTSIHNDSIWTLHQSNNKSWLFSGGRDHRLFMWNNNGELIRIFDGHSDNIWKISSSYNDTYVASCSSDKTIKVWNIGSSAALFTLKYHTDVVRDIVFYDDNYLYSCGTDKRILFWDLKNQSKKYESQCFNPLQCIVKAGNEVVTGDSKGYIYFFDKYLNLKFSLKVHYSDVRTMIYIDEKNCIISGDSSGEISIYYLATKELKIFKSNSRFVNRIRVFNNKIFSAGFDGTINILSYEGEFELSTNVNDLIYKNDNKFSCYKMKISSDVDLSDERKKCLIEMGAEIIEANIDGKRNTMILRNRKFKIGVTFTGEHREDKVLPVLNELINKYGFTREDIFYDYWHPAMFNGIKGAQKLQNIYLNNCDLVVVFLSSEYNIKPWTGGVEWRAILEIINSKRENKEVCLIDADGVEIAKIDGLFPNSDIATPFAPYGVNGIANMIAEIYEDLKLSTLAIS